MKILLTGSSGFIGLHTSKLFKKAGNLVINFAGDVTKAKAWKAALVKSPEVIVHVAGVRTESKKDFLVNTGGMDKLLRALKIDYTRPKILVHISSQAVYAGQNTPFQDNVRLNPVSSYAKSKLNAEQIAQKIGKKYNIRVIILRLSTTLGAGIREGNNMSGPLVVWAKNARNGKALEIFQDGLQSRDYVNVDDVAAAILLSVKNEKMSGVFNVGGGKKISLLKLAKLVKVATNSKSKIVIKGGSPSVADQRVMFSDISKIKKFGWVPKKTVKNSVQEYIASTSSIT
jgi:nucleoside-diphosphate-sugar epimerase